MNEAEFWQHLEYRLCDEFANMRLSDAPGLWCDGLIPEQRSFDADPAWIAGSAWVGGLRGHHPARHEEQWRFLLRIHGLGFSKPPLSWSELLPDEAAHGWVDASVADRKLVIDVHAPPGAD